MESETVLKTEHSEGPLSSIPPIKNGLVKKIEWNHLEVSCLLFLH